MKTRKLKKNDIKADEYYNLAETALMLNVHQSTLSRACNNKKLKCINIWTEKRSTFRVLWKDLLDFINNKK